MRKPQAGDAVILVGNYMQARIGDIGIIDGAVHSVKDDVDFVFAASSFKDDRYVSSSGGPCPHSVPISELQPTGRMIKRNFWNWGGSSPGAGKGVAYEEEVVLWSWVGEGLSSYYGELSVDEILFRRYQAARPQIPLNKNDTNSTPFRGDYSLIRWYGNTPNSDEMGEYLALLYQNFDWLYGSYSENAINGYRYFVSKWDYSTAFTTKAEFDSWLGAYNILLVNNERGRNWYLYPTPQNTWRQVTYQ